MTEITVALLIAAAAADVGRPTLVLQAKESARSSPDSTAVGLAHGQLRVEGNAAGSPHVAKLDGTGKPSTYRLVPWGAYHPPAKFAGLGKETFP